jgi:hypothetical protein
VLVDILGDQLTNPTAQVDIPVCAERTWLWFHDLHATRGEGVNGYLPISYLEIAAWSLLSGERLMPWELQAIRALDRRLLRKADPAVPAVDSTKPLTPVLFDTLFSGKAK